MKKVLPVLAVVLVFVLGLGIMLYPTIANYLNAQSQTVAIDHYEEAARANAAYYEGLLGQAQAFNEGVLARGTLAVMTEEEEAEYNSLLNLNGDGVMGYIEIPRLDLKLSIGHGTEEDVLQKMVGHLEGTSLPVGGASSHAVLSAHRGLPSAKRLFADMLGTVPDEVIVGGNSSLNMMFDYISTAYSHGVCGGEPWCRQGEVKFLCPAPGYDRHFGITEYFGIEMLTVPMTDQGPDMTVV